MAARTLKEAAAVADADGVRALVVVLAGSGGACDLGPPWWMHLALVALALAVRRAAAGRRARRSSISGSGPVVAGPSPAVPRGVTVLPGKVTAPPEAPLPPTVSVHPAGPEPARCGCGATPDLRRADDRASGGACGEVSCRGCVPMLLSSPHGRTASSVPLHYPHAPVVLDLDQLATAAR